MEGKLLRSSIFNLCLLVCLLVCSFVCEDAIMNEYPSCILARVSLTWCARGASECGQSFLMNEPGSSLHNGMKTFKK